MLSTTNVQGPKKALFPLPDSRKDRRKKAGEPTWGCMWGHEGKCSTLMSTYLHGPTHLIKTHPVYQPSKAVPVSPVSCITMPALQCEKHSYTAMSMCGSMDVPAGKVYQPCPDRKGF